MTLEPLWTLLEGREFRAGLGWGFAALILGVGAAALWRGAGRRGPVPAAGVLIATAGSVALWVRVTPGQGVLFKDPVLPAGLVLGLGILLLAGLMADRARWSPTVAAAMGVPGACLIATSADLVDVTWVRIAVAAVTVIGGWLVASFDRRWASEGLAPPMLALSAVGIYFTVPDTPEAMVLLGVAVPIAVLGWPLRLFSMGTGGSLAATGFLCWTVAAGGYGRSSSIVGGLACLGLLAVEPLAHLVAPAGPLRRRGSRYAPVAGLTVHLGLVFLASRVAGVRRTVPAALAIAGAEMLLATAALSALGRVSHSAERAPSPPDRARP